MMLAALLANLTQDFIGEIPAPFLMTFATWAARTAETLGVAGSVPPPTAEWRTWARAMIAAPQLHGYSFPGPDDFEKWQDWAISCKRVYPGA